jgi:hypothetical protein
MRCPVFRRREAEGVLPSGELTADIATTDIVIQPETADMRQRAAGDADGIHGAAIVRLLCPSHRLSSLSSGRIHRPTMATAAARSVFGLPPANVELKRYVPFAEPEEAEEANRYRKGIVWEASIQPTHHLGPVQVSAWSSPPVRTLQHLERLLIVCLFR